MLKKNGIEFMLAWDDAEMEELLRIRNNAAIHLQKSNYIPAGIFKKTEQLLMEYRAAEEKASSDKAETPAQ